MGANMQFNGYFPGYYAPKNIGFDAIGNGNVWPQNGSERISGSGNFSDGFFSPEYLLAYNKELLKRTMLKHEVIFKDQIQELHRLYRRQTELMGETRRNQNHHHRSNLSHSNAGFPFINLPNSQISVLGSGIIQSPLTSVQGTKGQTCPSYYSIKSEACSENIQFNNSKFRKIGKKVLDLQLPAEEYIDCDETDENYSSRPEISSYSMNRSSQFALNSALESENQNRFGDLSFCEFSGKTSSIFKSPLEHLFQNNRVLGNIIPTHDKVNGTFHQSLFNNHVPQPEKNPEPKVSLRELCDSRRTPIAVQALPCFNGKRYKQSVRKPGVSPENNSVNANSRTLQNSVNPTLMESSSLEDSLKGKRKCPALDLNMACESDSELTVDELAGENKTERGIIDLNSSMNESETDFTAPPSPENKECSPPRGEKSDTNQPEMPERDELARIAAEAIVSLSSFRRWNSSPESLHWFAGIVSSAEEDHFEAMTLSLAEAKPEELAEMTEMPLSPGRRKMGRARRRRKDFQLEILPGLAALSRYEVTEDLRTMEAAGNRCLRARKRVVSGTGEAVSGASEAVSLLEQIGGCWGTVTRRRRGRRLPVRVRNHQKFIILN